ILNSMLNAIDGSTQLLERAKKLGKVLSEYHPSLYPVNVLEVIKNSLLLVKAMHPDEKITEEQKVRLGRTRPDFLKNSVMVMADDLLGEAIVNIYANSVKYSRGGRISIGAIVEDEDERDNNNPKQVKPRMVSVAQKDQLVPFVKISIVDEGKGIPDDLKLKLFSRYLENAKGSGLGLSIVHALIVNRYKGKIFVRNRIPEDFTKGTIVEIWLPKA
ncbi:MAG: sensor histidine kinase, partial [Nitrososphaerales archaeon]